MLGYIGKAARLVLLLVANPNLLLLIKDVRLIKTGGRLELEVRTHSRNTVASSPAPFRKDWCATDARPDSTTGRARPPQLPACDTLAPS